jgi:hypothetical protein
LRLRLRIRRKEGLLSTGILSWFAPVTGLAAALMVSLNLGARFTGYGFVVFAVSSLAWIGLGLAEEMQSLVIQNGVLFATNLVGVYRWLFLRSPKFPAKAVGPERPAAHGFVA